MKNVRRLLQALLVLGALGTCGVAVTPAIGQDDDGDEPPLPENVVVDVDAIEQAVFRIGIPDLLGTGPKAREGGAIMRNDFTLMPGYQVIDPSEIRHDLQAEGLNIRPGSWGPLRASGVIKGRVTTQGNRLRVEMKFFRVSQANSPAFQRTYEGSPDLFRRWMHHFGNQVLRELTQVEGPFGTKLTFARRLGPGRKNVMCAHMDGHNALTVSNGRGITMLPTFADNGHIWFTRLTMSGMFITRSATRGRRIISGNGLNMAPSICNNRIYFVSSRDGNSEIYSSDMQGRGIRRLTNDRGIDVSPSCGPAGKIVFVSNRHGSPQIFIMNNDGTGQRRLTFRGNHNQTPTFCPDPQRPLVAFTGRDSGLDIFTVNINTQGYTRLTQGQGSNKDPAFSPDCRIVAFTSNRRRAPGVYLSSPAGFNQHRVIEGAAETIRWSRRRPQVE